MFETFGRSWQLVKTSWRALQQDRELLTFPLMSMIGVIITTLVFALPFIAVSGATSGSTNGEDGFNILGLIVLFLYYLVVYTITVYSNTAVISAAMIRLDGGDPTLQDGFSIANGRLRTIVGYAAIAATVGVILRMIRGDNDNIFTQIIAGLLAAAWDVITFLVVPVIVVEDLNPVDAIKRSGSLLRQTWGEQIIGSGGVGLVFGLIMLAVLLVGGLFVAGAAAISGALAVIVGGLVLIALVGVGLVGGALGSIYRAALYKYATQGHVEAFFDDSVMQAAFKPKRG